MVHPLFSVGGLTVSGRALSPLTRCHSVGFWNVPAQMPGRREAIGLVFIKQIGG